ncbi:Clp protease ClpP [Clostridium perfringens]|uniref:head maturation protease, ClpP-related n=1 Tax=Clostridium perfringens TaxID=1502 RepID=UPI00237D7434|nr:head maturation protease, ClpP-related [Clostridium perfringens]WDT40964.1 Clp protease ClpP [Clostridium perfringens]
MSNLPKINDNLKEFLQIKNQTETSCDLYFYGDIVSSWWGAWDDTDQYPEAVRDFLCEAKGKDLNIHINSGGGSVFAGITIYNMLKNHEGNKTVYIDGIAASIASVIALAGDKVIMRTGTSFMIHKPMFCLWDMYNSDELRKMATDLDAIQECVMQVYEENLNEGIDISEIEEMVNQETWLTGEQAKKYFNIELQEENAVACVSEMFDKYKNTPKNLSKIENNEIQKELKDRLQIELELLD